VRNVAGARESKCPGIEALVLKILRDVLRAVNPECAKLYPVGCRAVKP
jgi:hypothetical protein